jgi:hypothetical protein
MYSKGIIGWLNATQEMNQRGKVMRNMFCNSAAESFVNFLISDPACKEKASCHRHAASTALKKRIKSRNKGETMPSPRDG